MPLAVPEIRRLLCRLIFNAFVDDAFSFAWSTYRRHSQLSALRCHYTRRGLDPPF
jgi:hypothetical protein